MDKTAIKRILAWLGIGLILALFLYVSVQSYRLIISSDKEQTVVAKTQSEIEEETVNSRVNWSEVVVLSIVGAGLIYAIRKTNSKSES